MEIFRSREIGKNAKDTEHGEQLHMRQYWK